MEIKDSQLGGFVVSVENGMYKWKDRLISNLRMIFKSGYSSRGLRIELRAKKKWAGPGRMGEGEI